MPRRNHNMHASKKTAQTDRYDVDYISLPDAPEIAAISVPYMKTLFRNMCCRSCADTVHVVRSDNDKYLAMIRKCIEGGIG